MALFPDVDEMVWRAVYQIHLVASSTQDGSQRGLAAYFAKSGVSVE